MLAPEVRSALEAILDFCSYAMDLDLDEQILAEMDLQSEKFAEALEVLEKELS